jgi:hypothetical protein
MPVSLSLGKIQGTSRELSGNLHEVIHFKNPSLKPFIQSHSQKVYNTSVYMDEVEKGVKDEASRRELIGTECLFS